MTDTTLGSQATAKLFWAATSLFIFKPWSNWIRSMPLFCVAPPQHLDHALVSTTYSSQGVTANRVIVSATNDFTLSIESFYVATSRAKYNLHLYVENKAKLVEKAQTSRSQANPLELIREHQQKEVVTNKTTSTRVKEQNTNQTVQENYERNQTPQPNPQRDSDRNTQTPPPKTRGFREQPQHPTRSFRVEPPKLKDRVAELADGINSFVEQEETERLAESIKRLDRRIRNSFLSNEPNRRKTRPTQAKSKPTPIEARPGIVRDVVRVDVSRRSLNRSNQEFGHSSQQLRHNNEQYGQVEQRFKRTNQQYGRVQQDFRELAGRARNMPLEEVAERLGLEPDRYDSHKYKSDAHIISINDQKFYDHLNQKGGGGAIDLVMHVQQSSFKEAYEWLNGNAVNLTPVKQALSFSKQPLEREPFFPPVPDESKWRAVKDYLVNKRGLPESMVDTLHDGQGTLYADSKQNAVFIRKNMEGKITGASLRGTYNDSKFKGLAKGTTRDAGWFALKKGQGEIERIVLTESPIDAISAAAISQKKETTLFISTDGAGSIPLQFLQQKLVYGKQILVAYDNDEAGDKMARTVLEKLPGAQRITPTVGKDWNEQLIQDQNPVEQKKRLFRQEYERLKDLIHPNIRSAGMEKVDIGIAMRVIKEAVESGKSDNLLNRVGEVLSQSDKLKQWKQSMPENEYRGLAKDYVVQKFEQASLIRESILAERQRNKDIEFER